MSATLGDYLSGKTKSSKEDIQVSKRLMEAGKVIGIDVLNHIIVSNNSHTFLKEKVITERGKKSVETKKGTMKTEVTYDDEMKNKYLIRKEWDKNRKKALVIMKKAGQADEVVQDQTTMYVINNLSKLGYGVVEIANLFSTVEGVEMKESVVENLKCIQEAIAKVDDVIIAVGKGVETNKKAVERLNMILAILLDKKANILQIEAHFGRKGFHPLYPALKNRWKLVPHDDTIMSTNNIII
ncbi:DUF1643 domain-containing protein [Bacillus cereus]|uniref:DUF1643 domain-containing protein n=1 Tax=Bacillus cereus TaxID=1396 RepID=UPI001F4F1E54|nr:DUF1643 domain-containing protein [Bacillus cereus]MDF9506472.1 DUF1643 domain-containing protein [Bacillus cereus]MDF9595109.1 DUF1643 domain-containing protein [Bacillus cereus]MDF9606985.1 DUF1643 domain-containing protein [Bacillus cereus]MDF9657907.1 DUF1643 domain-containing protein [Bacillus cereus]